MRKFLASLLVVSMILMGINTPVKAEAAVADEFNPTECTGYGVLLEDSANVPMLMTLSGSVSEETEPDMSEEALYNRMIALQEDYPEGMSWTNDDYYAWNGGYYSGGYGCAAFAFILSDAAFGTLPARFVEENAFANIRVGDILRVNSDTHSVIVLEVYEDYVVIAEGNYNSSIHWGRTLTKSELEGGTLTNIMTRYETDPGEVVATPTPAPTATPTPAPTATPTVAPEESGSYTVTVYANGMTKDWASAATCELVNNRYSVTFDDLYDEARFNLPVSLDMTKCESIVYTIASQNGPVNFYVSYENGTKTNDGQYWNKSGSLEYTVTPPADITVDEVGVQLSGDPTDTSAVVFESVTFNMTGAGEDVTYGTAPAAESGSYTVTVYANGMTKDWASAATCELVNDRYSVTFDDLYDEARFNLPVSLDMDQCTSIIYQIASQDGPVNFYVSYENGTKTDDGQYWNKSGSLKYTVTPPAGITIDEVGVQLSGDPTGTSAVVFESVTFNMTGGGEDAVYGTKPTEDVTPTATPAPTATPVPTVAPTATPAPTAVPTATPTAAPTATPTVAPTATPTAAPTAAPTAVPTATPTVAPTATPTVAPTATPTVAPTATPTAAPTATPTAAPTAAPTATPTVAPTATPTVAPTATPTAAPTATPTVAPTATPTVAPTVAPTATPTVAPTATPTATPTVAPTAAPTEAPTAVPTAVPTAAPTAVPTEAPTAVPTAAPTAAPTEAPTAVPTAAPTEAPTAAPTTAPAQTPANKQPVATEDGKEGWQAINQKALAAKEGGRVEIYTNGNNTVPGTVFESIKGKNVDVFLNFGNGISWTINGMNVTDSRINNIDFTVILENESYQLNNIPEKLVKNLAGDKKTVDMSISHDGEFGFTGTLHVNLKAENAGKYANLYYYNETAGKLEFECAAKIGEKGITNLTLTHASEYTIVIADTPMQEIEVTIASPKTGDGWNLTGILVLGALIMVVGMFGVVILRKKY